MKSSTSSSTGDGGKINELQTLMHINVIDISQHEKGIIPWFFALSHIWQYIKI